MSHHFRCTACGKCCFGWVPLCIEEIAAQAVNFPLAMVWTPIRERTRGFAEAADLGTVIRTPAGRLALRTLPTAYIPPAFPCPKLTADGLCGIHPTKPQRCRTMPFWPYGAEADQAGSLTPRQGWACDVSAAAPLVYQHGRVLDRADYDRERSLLHAQAALLRNYAGAVLAGAPQLAGILAKVAATVGGNVVLSITTLLPHLTGFDAAAFAAGQLPVLADFAVRTEARPELAAYHRRYRDWQDEVKALTV